MDNGMKSSESTVIPSGYRPPLGPLDRLGAHVRWTAAPLNPGFPWLGAVLSGVLLAASYPPLEWRELAWLAFVPLLLAIRQASPRRALQLGCVAGAVFWLLNIWWLTRVTVAGWIALSLYCALYTGLFAVSASWLMRQWDVRRWYTNLALMLLLPLAWAGLEYMRSTLFTGFAWNPLGGSQYDRISLIQVAAWGGVYLVSALIMMINTAIALTVFRYIQMRGHGGRQPHPELMFGFLLLALAFSYGMRVVRDGQPGATPLRVSLIQPNIPQYEKWTKDFVDTIYDRLYTLTRMAQQAGEPDLIIWPETAVPDFIRTSRRSHDLVAELTAMQTPILVGSMDIARDEEGPPRYFNSAMLFDNGGELIKVYDKQHLVMFGEYVPLEGILPFIRAMTPIQASFDAGRESTVFRLETPDIGFSVLICFEDTVARLSRRAVREGARMLVNQTNDAWFDPSSASWQHMTHSVFRAVENRVPVVRAANTGISCSIDMFGRVVEEPIGSMVHGFKTTRIDVAPGDMTYTFYTRYGDLFGWAGMSVAWVLLAGTLYEWRRERLK